MILRVTHDDRGIVNHAERGDGLDYTLCGLGSEGDDGFSAYEKAEGRINCRYCMAFIRHCKTIRLKYECAKVEL